MVLIDTWHRPKTQNTQKGTLQNDQKVLCVIKKKWTEAIEEIEHYQQAELKIERLIQWNWYCYAGVPCTMHIAHTFLEIVSPILVHFVQYVWRHSWSVYLTWMCS